MVTEVSVQSNETEKKRSQCRSEEGDIHMGTSQTEL
jgi:hypothetical protein